MYIRTLMVLLQILRSKNNQLGNFPVKQEFHDGEHLERHDASVAGDESLQFSYHNHAQF